MLPPSNKPILVVLIVGLQAVGILKETTDNGVGDANSSRVFGVEEEEEHGLDGVHVANLKCFLEMANGNKFKN
jgi:hypothetical protein